MKKKEEDFKLEDEIDNKFNLLEIETNNEDEIINDNLNVEPENADEKLKLLEPYVEPMLEIPGQIEYFEKIKEEEKNEIEKIMDGAKPITTNEKIVKTIEDIVKGKENNVDGKIEDIFKDDNEVFENDDMAEDDKQFIRSLIDKTIFFPQNNEKDDNVDFTVEEVNVDQLE